MSIADNPRSHAQVTPFYQVRTTQEPVYQAQGSPIVSLYHREGAAGAPGTAPTARTNMDKCPRGQ
jgi:hypothetical protein